jgi:hypothetical protein
LNARQRTVALVLTLAIGVPAFALFFFSPLCDSDVGWHLAFGKYMVRHHTIPTTDVFRFTPQESLLHLHGWLSQVAFYALDRIGGLRLFRLGTSVVMLATLALLARLLYKMNGNVHLTALGVLVFFLTSVHLFHPRARIFTPPLFLLAFEQLGLDAEPLSARRLLGLFLLTVVWMNLHAEAAILPFFIGVQMLGDALTRPFPRKRVVSLGLAGALTFGALFVSPLHATWLPDAQQNYRINRENSWEWFNLFAYQGILDRVFSGAPAEYYPMFVHLLGYPFSLAVTMAVAASYLASLALRPKKTRGLPGVLVNLWALVLAFNMQRNSWLLFIPIASTLRILSARLGTVAPPDGARSRRLDLRHPQVIAAREDFCVNDKTRPPLRRGEYGGVTPSLARRRSLHRGTGAFGRQASARAGRDSPTRMRRWHTLAATGGLLLLAAFAFAAVVRPALWRAYDDDGWDARMFPTKAAAFLQAAGLGGKIFGEAEWGGYLIYTRPDVLVFMHGHWAEAPRTYADYQAILQERAGFTDLLDRYGTTLLVVPPSWGAALPGSKWVEVFRNTQSRVYVRSDDTASLAAVEAYYATLGIPFSRSAGFDPEQAVAAAPAWAREFRLQTP